MPDEHPESAVTEALATLGDRLERDSKLCAAAPQGDLRCLIGTPRSPVLLRFQAGRIASVLRAPGLMPDARFVFRASARAWFTFWQPMPPPGWHDLLALVKRGEANLDGDLLPFLRHLQFFKDLLALPRGHMGGEA